MSQVLMLPKKNNLQITPHFNSNEFDCPCSYCNHTLIHPDLPKFLELMRHILGSKLSITSAYRCPEYQKQLTFKGYETAKGISQHNLGNAVDVTNGVSLGTELEDAAKEAGFMSIGVGKNWIHVDLRMDKERRWYYNKKR